MILSERFLYSRLSLYGVINSVVTKKKRKRKRAKAYPRYYPRTCHLAVWQMVMVLAVSRCRSEVTTLTMLYEARDTLVRLIRRVEKYFPHILYIESCNQKQKEKKK